MNDGYLRGIYLRLAGILVLVVTVALLANAALSHRMFGRALAPQMAAKVASVGASVRALAFKWADNGVELKELFGVNQRFVEAMAEGPEISYMAITDPEGAILFESAKTPRGAAQHYRSAPVLALLQTSPYAGPPVQVGDQYIVSMPMVLPTRPLGTLHLGVDVRFVDDLVLDTLYDMGVVLVVTLFFTLEFLHFLAGAAFDGSLRALGDSFERGVRGDFAARPRGQRDPAFAGLLKHLDAVLAHINQAYAVLAGRLTQSLHAPAHERPPGIAEVRAGVASLAERFHFGAHERHESSDDGRVAKVRAPLFMFILAEELTRSFVPGYVTELLVPIAGLSPQIVIGLPIALFMLIVAVGQPFLGVYCQRAGRRRTMLVGAAIAALGFVATALSHSVLDLLLWRSLCALGYAMVFVAGQSFVLENATASSRVRSFAVFVGAIMAASVCGPSIGGILADNIGSRATFGAAAALAACSMLVIRLLPESRPSKLERESTRLPRLGEIGALLRNAQFMAVTGLAAIPAKVLLTGVCFYLIPLYMLSIGSTQAMAGRILMTYGVVMVVLAPLTAALATTRDRMHWLVGGGLIVSGVGAMLMLAGGSVGWVFLAAALVGLGQSMSISAQSALVSEHCAAEIERMGSGVVYGVYRLLERLGNAAGPLVAAAAALLLDYRMSFVAVGATVFACGLVFLLATRRRPAPALVAA
jgi:MFS family permease